MDVLDESNRDLSMSTFPRDEIEFFSGQGLHGTSQFQTKKLHETPRVFQAFGIVDVSRIMMTQNGGSAGLRWAKESVEDHASRKHDVILRYCCEALS
jgi:hypothetical protein